jgi:hypothetical protein
MELKHSEVYEAVPTNTHGSEEREIKLIVRRASTAVTVGEVVLSRSIPVLEFGGNVAELHADSNQPFKDLYQVVLHGKKIANFH